MKKRASIFLLTLLVASSVIPALPGFASKLNSPRILNDTHRGIVDGSKERPQDKVNLNIMHFSPSASNSDGIYYVARKSIDTIAYFGESKVYYVVGDALIVLEFSGSRQVIPTGEQATGSITNYMYGNDQSLWRTGLADCAVLRYANIYTGIDLVYSFQYETLKYEFIVSPYADPGAIRMSYPHADTVDVQEDCVTVLKDGFRVDDAGLRAYQNNSDIQTVACTFRRDNRLTAGLCVGRYDISRELLIDPAILLVYSTFLGGASYDTGYGIAVESGCAYVTGSTGSAGFPTVNAYDSIYNGGTCDCFVTKFAADGLSLVYSTFLGGTADDVGNAIAVESGCAYVTGHTLSTDFPTVNAYNSSYGGFGDCFVTKLAADGRSLAYSTFLGGTADDVGYAIAVESGCAYVTGSTESSGFPTLNAYDPSYAGARYCFVTKFAADGLSLVYSTFLGGTADNIGYAIAVKSGCAYVAGYTYSAGFPTVNAYDSTYGGAGDCFVTKFAADGLSLVYSTFLGETGYDYAFAIAVESGCAYVTGLTGSAGFPTVNAYDSIYNGGTCDCFVTKFAADGRSLAYSTFLGGTAGDVGYAIAVESGCAYVTGYESSPDFPTVNAFNSTYTGYQDCFITTFAGDGQSLVYSTLFGAVVEQGCGIAVESGCVYATGYTMSAGFPTVNAYDSTYNGGSSDCFMAILCADSDCDGLTDWAEARHGTNPLCIDTDNDNFLDGYEVAYGSDPLDPMSYPAMPQAWYDAIYKDLNGNATLIRNLIKWSNGNATMLKSLMQQLDANATLLQQVISWLDSNHTAIETLFGYVNGNATLLVQTVTELNANATRLELVAALATHNTALLAQMNASYVGDVNQIRAVLAKLGVNVGDTDYDGLDDLQELALGTNFQCIDTDCDNLNDAYEVKIGTNPLKADTDGDGFLDGVEVLAGTNPLDPNDYPGHTTQAAGIQPLLVVGIAGAAGVAGVVAGLMLLRRRTLSKALQGAPSERPTTDIIS